ncbi:Intraflagellar transport protein [Senna tora]|uniref:Intraflagellar transport protein n=1 Tax=Senna tora TaxID=362788 RepID=A0A834T9B2_9FABA|nr:Intraflagellar transport protein [Senna tora]
MGSGEGKPHWSVYDGVKIIAATPEALMAEIDSAISNLEYARATALLESSSSYDARMADEAYKTGCAALAAGKLDEALYSLNISLSKCPPDKISAVAKLQSLISLTSQQLQKSAN